MNLLDKVEALLDFTPGKPDKFADSNITSPVGPIERAINKGYFNPSCKLHHGSGFSYYHCYYNFEEKEFENVITHVYNPQILSDLQGMVVIHSHTQNEYCPWKSGCHVYLDGGLKEEMPKWFQDMWKELYS